MVFTFSSMTLRLGAQISATPVVPCAQATIGQPALGGVPFGVKTSDVANTSCPLIPSIL